MIDDAIKLINGVGFAVAMVVVFILGTAIVARWAKPWVEKILQAILTLLTTLSETQRRQEEALEQFAKNHERQTCLLDELKDASVTSNEILVEIKNGKHS